MNINYKEIEYKNFGKCLSINNGTIELIITLDIGPRVISFRMLNDENIFFEDIDRELYTKHPDMDKFFGEGATWQGLGGHRLWRAPESYSTYYPEDEPAQYVIKNNTFKFIQNTQIYNEVQLSFTLSFVSDNSVEFLGTIENKSNKEKTLSAWSLSMCKGPGIEILQLPKDASGFAPRVQYSIWGFGAKNNDPRAFYGNDYFSLKMEPGNQEAYKIGLRLKPGKVLYLNNDYAFITSFDRNDDMMYPDNNVNYETYTKDLFLEVETLSPLKTLKPNESQIIKEVWTLNKFDGELPEIVNDQILNDLYMKFIK